MAEQPIKRNKKEQDRFLEQYMVAGRDAGCPQDQILNFIKAGLFLNPVQLKMSAKARECDRQAEDAPTAVGVGGARGGSKSFWGFSQVFADDLQRYPGLKFLILRKTAKAMREQLRDMLGKICRHVPHNYREQAGTIEFPNGSYAIVGHFKDEKEIENYLGQEYDGIFIEELTTLTYEKFKNLMTCLRTSKPNWRPRLYAAWNWGGVGHFFTMKLFYEPWENGKEKETRYVKALVQDNPHVNEEYLKQLQSLTGWKYKSWYLGDPHFQAGQFFTNWNESVHVFPNKDTTFDQKQAVSYFAGYDYGFAHPSCFQLAAKDRQGNTYSLGEWHNSETVIEEQSEFIKDCCRQIHIDVSQLDYIAAGKDCFNRNEEGRTIAQEFDSHGINLTPVQIDRVNAWSIVHQRLGDVERGIAPTWFIHRRCTNLIAQIPMCQCHETRKGDIAKMNADSETGEGGDDAIEAARNMLVLEPSGVCSWAIPISVGSYKPISLGIGTG